MAPSKFDGDDFQAWAVRMEAYLEGCDLWEAVEDDYEIPPLPNNPTMAQIKNHKEKRTRKAKAKSCLFAAVSPAILSRIMTCESAKAIWDFLRAEYKGDERTRGIKVRVLGTDLPDRRLVQKILDSLPDRYEATIASLENTNDLSELKLAELLSALQAQERRRMMREEGTIEGALYAKFNPNFGGKGRKGSVGGSDVAATESNRGSNNNGGTHPPCQYCGRRNHPHYKCWRRPEMRCRRCQKLGHAEIICNDNKTQQQGEAQAAIQPEVEELFNASCLNSSISRDSWLIDSGSTNHMTSDVKLFKELDRSVSARVRIGNWTIHLSQGEMYSSHCKLQREKVSL